MDTTHRIMYQSLPNLNSFNNTLIKYSTIISISVATFVAQQFFQSALDRRKFSTGFEKGKISNFKKQTNSLEFGWISTQTQINFNVKLIKKIVQFCILVPILVTNFSEPSCKKEKNNFKKMLKLQVGNGRLRDGQTVRVG